MAVKELQTRIALKYDSYENWTKEQPEGSAVGKNLVLLAGEIGICEIPSANNDSRVAPTVLFKVGDGTKKFHELPWASAKAADVYGWAKSETVVLDGEVIKFKTGDTVNHTIDLSKFATDETVNGINERLAAIEGLFTGTDSVGALLEALDGRLDVIEGEGAGSIKKAAADTLKSAQDYADQAELDAVATANGYTDTEVAKDRARLDTLETAKGDHDSRITANANAIAQEVTDRTNAISDLDTAYKAADKAINDKIGTVEGTIGEAIADAKKAGTDAATAVNNLANGAVKTNTDNIATNTADIADLKTGLANEIEARENADDALDARLEKVEAFFAGAAEDKTIDGEIQNALDTLVEIQNYITNDGAAADEMVKDIAANTAAISAIQDIIKDGGSLEIRVDSAEAAIDALEGRADALEGRADAVEGRADVLEATVAGYDGTNTVKKAVDAVSVRAEKGITDAAAAQKAADDAQGEVDALEIVVAGVKSTADTAASDLAALTTRVGTAEGAITDIQGIVKTGDDSNANLRSAITELQGIVKTGADANATLRSDLTEARGVADGAASKAGENAGKIAAIEADYLKAADVYVFNCGTSTTVVHEA